MPLTVYDTDGNPIEVYDPVAQRIMAVAKLFEFTLPKTHGAAISREAIAILKKIRESIITPPKGQLVELQGGKARDQREER